MPPGVISRYIRFENRALMKSQLGLSHSHLVGCHGTSHFSVELTHVLHAGRVVSGTHEPVFQIPTLVMVR
jgi:hypothetical protein